MSAYEEENLRWSEVLVSCDVGAWELDPTSLILRFSPSGQKILGIELAKFETFSHFAEYFAEPYKAPIQKIFNRLIKEKVGFDEFLNLRMTPALGLKESS